MSMTTRKLLLSTAVLIGGISVASAQGMHEGVGAKEHGRAAADISNKGPQVRAHQRSQGHGRAQLGGQDAKRTTVGVSGQMDVHANAPSGARIGHSHQHVKTQATAHNNIHSGANAGEHRSTVGQAPPNATAERNAQLHKRSRHHARTNHPATTGQAANEAHGARRHAQTQQHAQTTGRATTGQAIHETHGRANVDVQNGNGGNRVQLTSQQRTRIRESVLTQHVPRINHPDFALNVGVVVPQTVNYVAISDYPYLVDVFPEYRDDYFVVSEEEIVILTPERRIVDVVPLNGSARIGEVSGDVELTAMEIRDVQRVLVDRGFDIQVDGIWGPRTRHALIAFQRREGLPPDGLITSRTVVSLGLRGKIAESHIKAQVSTTGQANGREKGQDTLHRNRSNAEGEHNRSNLNANAAAHNRSTTGQGGNEQQMQSIKGHNGSQKQSTKSQGVDKHDRSTTGQGNEQSSASVGEKPQGADASEGNMRRHKPEHQ